MEERSTCFNISDHNISMPNSIDPSALWYRQFDYDVEKENVSFTLQESYPIPYSSKFSVYVYGCRIRYTSASYRLDGNITFSNPFGYLKYNDYFNIPIYLGSLVAYTVLLSYWMVMSLYYRRNLHLYQKLLAAVLLICVLSSASSLIHFKVTNGSGFSRVSTALFHVFFLAASTTVVRGLFLAMASGFKIAYESKAITHIMLYGFLLTCIFIIEILVNSIESIRTFRHPYVSLIYVLPSLLIESLYIIVAFYSITEAIKILRLHRDTFKLKVMYGIKTILVVAGTLFTIVAYVHSTIITKQKMALWTLLWAFNLYWRLIYVCCIAYMMWLFHPSGNNLKYTNAVFNADINDDIDVIDPMEDENDMLYGKMKRN